MLRILFFQDFVPASLQPLTDADLHNVAKNYLARDYPLLAELKAERRPGRPRSTKQTLLEQQQHQEQKEYETGLWVPDMRTESNLEKLRDWKGEWVSLTHLTFVRIGKGGGVKESAWPPKGAA